MIVVTLMGGLGNQMFQYAFGRAASLELDRQLVLDLSLMPTGRTPYIREFGLSRLPIASVRELAASGLRRTPDRPRPMVNRLGRLVHRSLRRHRVSDPPDDQVLRTSDLPSPIALCVGYWQSHLYFETVGEIIRAELRPIGGLSACATDLMLKASAHESIAVHVRRGDYVAEARVAQVHGTLDGTYHAAAVARIAQRMERPLALVFSDDPDWASKNLELGVETIHAEKETRLEAVETLGIMASCSHHVIANSSLSWWGAYLAAHPDQHVIYPRRWFLDKEVNPGVRFPAHWSPHEPA